MVSTCRRRAGFFIMVSDTVCLQSSKDVLGTQIAHQIGFRFQSAFNILQSVDVWYESRNPAGIPVPAFAKTGTTVPLLAAGQPCVHPDQHREHRERQEGRPLHEKAQHDQHEPHILGMANAGIGACRRKRPLTLRILQMVPCHGYQPEAAADKDEAQEVERPEVWV